MHLRSRALTSPILLKNMESSPGNTSSCPESTAEFQFYLFPVTYFLAMALGLPGNLWALYFFLFKTETKSPSNFYIISLAIADTVFLCVLPFRIHYHINGNNWVFGDVMCRLTGSVFFINIHISIAFMTCICVDRYIATVHPHKYLQLRNSSCATVVTASVWLVAGGVVLAFMLTSPLSKGKNCFENFSEEQWKNRLAVYSILCLVFGSLIPSLVILVCYPLVARRIARIKTATARSALRVIYAILAITVLCFLPYHVVHFLHLLWRTQFIHQCGIADVIYKSRRVTMALVSLNSLLDPLLYYFATSRCKWSFKCWKPRRRMKGVFTISDSFKK